MLPRGFFLCARFIFLALADNVLPEFFLTLCPLPPFILAKCGLEYGGNNSLLEFYSSPEKLFFCVYSFPIVYLALIFTSTPCFLRNLLLVSHSFAGFSNLLTFFILREYYLFYHYFLDLESLLWQRVFAT